jgi:hypothetical protein
VTVSLKASSFLIVGDQFTWRRVTFLCELCFFLGYRGHLKLSDLFTSCLTLILLSFVLRRCSIVPDGDWGVMHWKLFWRKLPWRNHGTLSVLAWRD